jgi:hypothetical protein
MRKLAEQQQVREDIIHDHKILKPGPGTLTKHHLETLAEQVVGDVSILLKFSPAVASEITPETYQRYESRYSNKKRQKPWRPWNVEDQLTQTQ